MPNRLSARATAWLIGLALGFSALAVAPANAQESPTIEEANTLVGLEDVGSMARSIGPASITRTFAGVHAQFGAEHAVFLPGAQGVPDRIVSTSGYTGTAPIIDLDTGLAAVLPITGLNGIAGIATTPTSTSASGTIYIAEVFSPRVAVYDIASASIVGRISVPVGQPSALAFAPDDSGTGGTLFVASSSGDMIVGVDVATGNTVMNAILPWDSWIGGVTIGADASATSGSIFVTDRGRRGTLLRIDIATGATIDVRQLFPAAQSDSVRPIQLISGDAAGNERLLVSNTSLGRAMIYDLETGTFTKEYPLAKPAIYPNTSGIEAVAYRPGEAPGAGQVISYHTYGEVTVTDEATGAEVFRLPSLGFPVGGIGFIADEEGSIDGEVFVADRLTNSVKVYDTQAQKISRTLELPPKYEFPSLAVSGGGEPKLVVGLNDGPVQIRSVATGAVEKTINIAATSISAIAGTTQVLVSDTQAKTLTVVDAQTGQAGAKAKLSFSPGAAAAGVHPVHGEVLFVPNSGGGAIEILDPDTFAVIDSISGFAAPTQAAQRGASQLLVLERGGVLRIVSLTDNSLVGAVRTGFNASGMTVVENPADGGARVYAADRTMGISLTNLQGIRIAPDTLPDGLVGEPYEAELEITGTPLPEISVDGDLPLGLSLDPETAIISGIPTKPGKSTFTVRAENAAAPETVKEFTIDVYESPAIATEYLLNGVVGEEYLGTLDVSGVPSPALTVSNGKLPGGLAADSDGRTLSGVPTTAGEFRFSVSASNGKGTAAEREYLVVIQQAPAILTKSLPGGVIDEPYTGKIRTTGSPEPTVKVTDGNLPAGIAVDGSTGELTGTPKRAGNYQFTVSASNGVGADAVRSYEVVVQPQKQSKVTPKGKGKDGEEDSALKPNPQPKGDDSTLLASTGWSMLLGAGTIAVACVAVGSLLLLRRRNEKALGS